MKSLLRFTLLFAAACALSARVQAQDDIDQMLQSNVEDGEKLIGAYISPLMKSVASGLNQGWYNTAKPHKIAGIDITITANLMKIPDDQMFYNVKALGMKEIELDETSPDFSSGNAPTIFGPGEGHEPVFKYEVEAEGQTETLQFDGPPGLGMKEEIGMNVMPVPMAQLGIGLPKGTDVKLRLIPKMELGDGMQMNMFGIGVMHDIKQWIPGIKEAPFDLSGFFGYTKFKMEAEFDEDNVENGRGVFEMSGATIQGVISKKISVLTVYGGLGYNIAKSRIAMLGTYTLEGGSSDIEVKDPVDLSFGASGPRLTAGFRLKLAILTLHADYTLQKYNCLTAGIGLSVR